MKTKIPLWINALQVVILAILSFQTYACFFEPELLFHGIIVDATSARSIYVLAGRNAVMAAISLLALVKQSPRFYSFAFLVHGLRELQDMFIVPLTGEPGAEAFAVFFVFLIVFVIPEILAYFKLDKIARDSEQYRNGPHTMINKIGDLSIANFTDARLMVERSVAIEAAPEKIWQVMNDQSMVAKWMPSIKRLESVNTDNADDDGVGTERIAVYGSGDKIKETVVYAEKNKVLAYQAAFPSMVKDHLSVIEIKANGANSSTVCLYAFFTPTEFTGYLMKYGVYALIVKSSLKKLSALCGSNGRSD